ncbi:transporter substrate-binding domain-containing protein [Plantactinospora sp. KBS50]|uniref:transporter substrate-binding domain-containing protein n=1 Tax=Plantactinospora sp. KBS50 TaxID=2024580 RepID=UPI000BAAEE20|nr:transporter substrate-binding domain-containing protein [Plantactinospora sp. KBS50]ASW54557.1 glutamate ABC transporter substrate-binding protein [Plantactinospora sp. KBS50]
MSQDSEPARAAGGSGPTAPPAERASLPRVLWFRRLRLVALLVVLVLGGVAVVRVVTAGGPPTRQDLLERAGLVGKQQLTIGVKDDQPGIAQVAPDGSYAGFDIDIAMMIAGDLGFAPSAVRLLPIESEDRIRRQARDGDRFVTVDMVVASFSITQDRIDHGATFSAPYLSTEQSVVTLKTDERPVDSLRDLRGRKVCTLATSTAEDNLRNLGAQVSTRKRVSECVQDLYDGRLDAVITDAAILAGFVAHRPGDPWLVERAKPLRQWDIGEAGQELYGVNTGSNVALRDLVDLSLYGSATDPKDRRWEDAFDRNLRWEQPANLPQQVAVDQQPAARKVEVRQWPWETVALPPPVAFRRAARTGARARGRRSSGC